MWLSEQGLHWIKSRLSSAVCKQPKENVNCRHGTPKCKGTELWHLPVLLKKSPSEYSHRRVWYGVISALIIWAQLLATGQGFIFSETCHGFDRDSERQPRSRHGCNGCKDDATPQQARRPRRRSWQTSYSRSSPVLAVASSCSTNHLSSCPQWVKALSDSVSQHTRSGNDFARLRLWLRNQVSILQNVVAKVCEMPWNYKWQDRQGRAKWHYNQKHWQVTLTTELDQIWFQTFMYSSLLKIRVLNRIRNKKFCFLGFGLRRFDFPTTQTTARSQCGLNVGRAARRWVSLHNQAAQ